MRIIEVCIIWEVTSHMYNTRAESYWRQEVQHTDNLPHFSLKACSMLINNIIWNIMIITDMIVPHQDIPMPESSCAAASFTIIIFGLIMNKRL